MAAGYSGTPLSTKLGIKDGSRVVLLGAPRDFDQELAPLPEGVRLMTRLPTGRTVDVAVLFCGNLKQLIGGFGKARDHLTPAGGLWVAWPKKASGVETDLDENLIRDHGLAAGLVDNKVCAVTQVWSGLRFVYRVQDRAGLSPSRSASPGSGGSSRPGRSASPRARRT